MDDSGLNSVNREYVLVDEYECNENKQGSPKAKKKRSIVWDHFTTLVEKKGETPKARCNHCGQEYSCHSNNNGTSSMKTHIVKLCREYDFSEYNIKRKGDKRQKILSFGGVSGGGTVPQLTAVSFSVDACRKALAKMIVLDELPFRFVEGQGFKEFMQVVQPKWTKIPSRVTIAKDCIQLYRDEKKVLKRALRDQRICLTTDTWTSLQNLNYMCLTAHFIDCDWIFHKKILNFCLVPNHKGETLGKVVEKCLVEWGIDKIMTITIDNASSNNGIIDFLKKKTMKSDSTILNHDFLHVRCCAHILNLVVREGLKDVDVSIARVRNIVKYVRSSPARYGKFRSCADRDKIESKLVPCLDVATRWNSTYFMLERALIYQKAFDRLEEEDNMSLYVGVREDEGGVDDHEFEIENENDMERENLLVGPSERKKRQGKGRERGTPTSDDWKVVELYVEVLKVFYLVTERFSGSLYVTSNTFFKEVMRVKNAIAKLENSDDAKLVLLARGMNKNFDKYWGEFEKINSLLLYANVLDPRYKFNFVRWSLNKHHDKMVVQNKVLEMKDGMTRLYNWYEKSIVDHGRPQQVEFSRNKEKNARQSMDFGETMENEFDDFMEEESNMVIKSELERYWSETNEDGKKLGDNWNLLTWWKDNTDKYPILSRMARDILAIPVSTVASESAFSTGGRILDPYRTSLSPEVAEALICAQNWLRYPSQISLRDQLDEVEALESEILGDLREESCVTHI